MLNGLKEASENSQDDAALLDKESVGNFLQKFEAKATKKTGLLEQKEQRYGENLSEFAGKSNVDSILDSGNFCNDDSSPYRDMHSRNNSGVPHQFADRFDRLRINNKLNRNKNDGFSHEVSQESADKLRSDNESMGVG